MATSSYPPPSRRHSAFTQAGIARVAGIFFAVVAACLNACTPAVAVKTGEQELASSIVRANAYARACVGSRQACVGRTVVLLLRQHAVITRPLPALKASASLTVVGSCIKLGKPIACVIDGSNTFPIFTSPAAAVSPKTPAATPATTAAAAVAAATTAIPASSSPAAAPVSSTSSGSMAQLVLKNLVVRRAVGGVFSNLWANISAVGVEFKYNTDGVDKSTLMAQRGVVPRTFTNCTFMDNNGTVLFYHGALVAPGVANARAVVYRVRNSAFVRNAGRPYGAVHIAGVGRSVFEDVVFHRNTAALFGGGIHVEQTSVMLLRVRFARNTATLGGGGGIYAIAGTSTPLSVTLCRTTFASNTARFSRDVYFGMSSSAAAVTPSRTLGSVRFCDTRKPRDTMLVLTQNWSVTVAEGRPCLPICKAA